MNQPSDEIKAKLDIVDVIREYIQLKAAGMNFRALCPFHREKTPSFMVSPEKQIWHCFGCQKGGDVISFVMEIEGLNFVEALRQLAIKAGVTLRRQDPKIASQRNRLLDIVDLSSKYYHKVLLESRGAEVARKYLAQRGLEEETIEDWRVGYSPDSWDDLIKFLVSRGYKEQEIFLAGMSVKKEGASRFYNRFRGRIMFSIYDVNGNAVAFSARVNPENEEGEKMGKYINSPQTPIYDKSNILFGLDKAKLEIKKQDLAVVVEGQMDVITAHQHGFANVVASSGTALTEEQINLLKRYTENFVFALDSDSAGQIAIDRGDNIVQRVDYQEVESEDSFGNLHRYIDPHRTYKINRKVIELPTGQDPDDYIKNNPEEWTKAVENAKPMMQYYFDKTFAALDTDNVEDKRLAAQKLLPILNKLGNMIEQDFWLKKLSEIIDVKEAILRETLLILTPDKSRQKREPTRPMETAPVKKTREGMLSELLLAFILKFPQFTDYIINNIQPDQIIELSNQALYRKLVIYYNNIIDNRAETSMEGENPLVKYEDFRIWLADSSDYNSDSQQEEVANQLRLLDKLVILGDKDFYDYDSTQAKNEIIKTIIVLKKRHLADRGKEVEKLIAQAEKENDDEAIKGLMEEFKALSEESRELDN